MTTSDPVDQARAWLEAKTGRPVPRELAAGDGPGAPASPPPPGAGGTGWDSSGSDRSGSRPSGSDLSRSRSSEPSGSGSSGWEPSGSGSSGWEPSGSGSSGWEPSGSGSSGWEPSGSGPSGSGPSGSGSTGSDSSAPRSSAWGSSGSGLSEAESGRASSRRHTSGRQRSGRKSSTRRSFGMSASGEREGDAEPPEPDADPVEVARNIAFRKLAASARTRHELDAALQKKNVPDEVAATVLDRLEEVGLVDDEAFAQSWVESRQQRRHLSRSALRRELSSKGVDRDHVDAALATVDVEDELAAARARTRVRLRWVQRYPQATRRPRALSTDPIAPRSDVSGGA